jgi:biotin carboxyl carrier protein
MIKLKVNASTEMQVEIDPLKKTCVVDGHTFALEMEEIEKDFFHVIKNHRSYTAEILRADYTSKTFTIKVNDREYTVVAEDRYDALLQNLGMEPAGQLKINDVKAPMPGLILDIKVGVGQEIKKGDLLLVLEAMKMENNIKASSEGIIKQIHVVKGNKVEKNEVLITLG